MVWNSQAIRLPCWCFPKKTIPRRWNGWTTVWFVLPPSFCIPLPWSGRQSTRPGRWRDIRSPACTRTCSFPAWTSCQANAHTGKKRENWGKVLWFCLTAKPLEGVANRSSPNSNDVFRKVCRNKAHLLQVCFVFHNESLTRTNLQKGTQCKCKNNANQLNAWLMTVRCCEWTAKPSRWILMSCGDQRSTVWSSMKLSHSIVSAIHGYKVLCAWMMMKTFLSMFEKLLQKQDNQAASMIVSICHQRNITSWEQHVIIPPVPSRTNQLHANCVTAPHGAAARHSARHRNFHCFHLFPWSLSSTLRHIKHHREWKQNQNKQCKNMKVTCTVTKSSGFRSKKITHSKHSTRNWTHKFCPFENNSTTKLWSDSDQSLPRISRF